MNMLMRSRVYHNYMPLFKNEEEAQAFIRTYQQKNFGMHAIIVQPLHWDQNKNNNALPTMETIWYRW